MHASVFPLPPPLQVVSHYPGADGVWRVGSAVRDFALKVVRPHGAWGERQAADQTALVLAAAPAGLPVPAHVPPAIGGAGIFAVMPPARGDAADAPVRRLASLHEWVETLPDAAPLDPAAVHGWLGATLARLHGLLPPGGEAAGARPRRRL